MTLLLRYLGILLLLTGFACGGGGGSTSTPTPAPPATPNLVVSSVSPTTGWPGATITLTLTGFAGFGPVSGVWVGGLPVTPAQVSSTPASRTIQFTLPAGLASGNPVIQVNAGVFSCTSTALTYQPVAPRNWGAPFMAGTALLQGPLTNAFTQFQMNPGGGGMALWQQYFGSSMVLWTSFYAPGAGWGSKMLLSDRISQIGNQPSAFACNEAGNAVVLLDGAFIDDLVDETQNGTLYARTYDPATGWSALTVLQGAALNFSDPNVVLGADGRTLAVWVSVDPSVTGIISRVRSCVFTPGQGWSAPVDVDGASGNFVGNLGQLFASQDGKILALWEEMHASNLLLTDLVACEFDWSTAWSQPKALVASTAISPHCERYVGDAQGRRLLVYAGGPDTGSLTLQSQGYTPAQGWTALVSPTPPRAVDAQLAQIAYDMDRAKPPLYLDMNASGQAVLGWTDDRGAVVRTFDPAGGWGPDEVLVGPGTTGGNGFPCVAIDPAGDAMAGWAGYSRKFDDGYLSDALCAFMPVGGTWQAPHRIDQANRPLIQSPGVRVAVDGQGRFQMGWPGCDAAWWTADELFTPGPYVYPAMFTNHFDAAGGYGSPAALSDLAFGQGVHPCVGLQPDGSFLLGWAQQERALQSPWGVPVAQAQPLASQTLIDLGQSIMRPFTADIGPVGPCGPPAIATNLPLFPFRGNDSAVAMAWVETTAGHARLCANYGVNGRGWNLAPKDPNPAGLDADQPLLASLPGANVPAGVGIFRNTDGQGGHQVWMYSLLASPPRLSTTVLSAPGAEVDALALASDGQSTCMALWQQMGAAWEIWTSDYQGGTQTWTAPVRLAGLQGGSIAPRGAMTAAGTRLAAWINGAAQEEVWTSGCTAGSGWTAPLPVAQPGQPITALDLATDGASTFALAWCQGSGATAQAWGRVFTVGSGWGDPLALASGSVAGVKVDLDGSGRVVFAWLEGAAPAQEVFTRAWSASGGLEATAHLSDGQGQCSELKLKAAPAGPVLAVWTQVHDGLSQIWGAYYY